MRLTRYTDLRAFVARAEPLLLAREAEHCLSIGILTMLQRGEALGATPPYLALVEDDGGRVVAAPLATPPHNLILSYLAPCAESASDEILRLIADDTFTALPDLPGVLGPTALARRFGELWAALSGATARLGIFERIYWLDAVRPVRPVAGAMRRITEGDRPLLRTWLRAFFIEALDLPDDPQAEVTIDQQLRFDSRGMYLWQAPEGVVSLAGYSGPTPHGMRIGPVYTPPEARGKGYASALVARLSQRLLDEGRQFVFLFTDLANPTSNHIYQEIGYQPVADVIEVRFERPGDASD